MSDSTISGNAANDGYGGGMWLYHTSATSPVTVSASTLSGNTAKSNETRGSFGGGMVLGGTGANYSNYSWINSAVRVVDSTVAGNSADRGGGVSVGFTVNGFTPHTRYHYRLVAVRGTGRRRRRPTRRS